MCSSFVYILATGKNGQLQLGLTDDLVHHVWQHRSGQMAAKTSAPASHSLLVWHEAFDDLAEAEARLERLSRWPDAWFARLIEKENPDWKDLWTGLKDQPAIGISPAFIHHKTTATPSYPILRPMLQVA